MSGGQGEMGKVTDGRRVMGKDCVAQGPWGVGCMSMYLFVCIHVGLACICVIVCTVNVYLFSCWICVSG